MFGRARQVEVGDAEPKRTTLSGLEDATRGRLDGAEAMQIHSGVVDVRSQVRTVIGKVREVNKGATTDLTAKVELDWTMSNNVAAIWDYSKRTIVLNAQTALTHPEDLPFIVAHEAAHGGLLRATKGKGVKAESVADLIAELETGQNLSDAYDGSVDALKKISKRLDEHARLQGHKSGAHYAIDVYSKDGATKLFQTLLSASINRGSKALNEAIQLFKAAFPDAKVSYTGENIVTSKDITRATGDAVQQTLFGEPQGPAANDDDDTRLAS